MPQSYYLLYTKNKKQRNKNTQTNKQKQKQNKQTNKTKNKTKQKKKHIFTQMGGEGSLIIQSSDRGSQNTAMVLSDIHIERGGSPITVFLYKFYSPI